MPNENPQEQHPNSKGVARVFASLEQIRADEPFKQHFPHIKRHLINALLLKGAQNNLPANPKPEDYEDLGRRSAVYDEIISMIDSLGEYQGMAPKPEVRKFRKLQDPNHT